MSYQTIPLHIVCPCWGGQLIPSAFAALEHGLRVERERSRGKPYVAVGRVRDIDYDGLTEEVHLLGYFAGEAEAVEHARGWAAAEAARVLAGPPGTGGDRWKLYDSALPVFFEPGPDAAAVRLVHHEHWCLQDDSQFNKIRFQSQVVLVTAAEVLGPDLFEYLGSELEVVSHFIRLGEAAGPAA